MLLCHHIWLTVCLPVLLYILNSMSPTELMADNDVSSESGAEEDVFEHDDDSDHLADYESMNNFFMFITHCCIA